MLCQSGATSRDQRAAVCQLPLLASARDGVTRRSLGLREGTVRIGRDPSPRLRGAALAQALQDAREYTLRLYAHLTPGQRRVLLLDVINPPAW